MRQEAPDRQLPAVHKISPQHTAEKISPGTFDDWVDVYEDRVVGWFFDHAHIVRAHSQYGGFVVLQIALAFIEGYETYRTGEESRGRSKEFFKRGFQRIFTDEVHGVPAGVPDELANLLYSDARCGLFHDGQVKGRIFLFEEEGKLLEFFPDLGLIRINPYAFLDIIETHFRIYIARLRNPDDPEADELRANFEKRWHSFHAPSSG